MIKKYSPEFKLEAVKRVVSSGAPVARVAAELGVNENTLHGWMKKYRDKPSSPFQGSGKLSEEDKRMRNLERQNRELREVFLIFMYLFNFIN